MSDLIALVLSDKSVSIAPKRSDFSQVLRQVAKENTPSGSGESENESVELWSIFENTKDDFFLLLSDLCTFSILGHKLLYFRGHVG